MTLSLSRRAPRTPPASRALGATLLTLAALTALPRSTPETERPEPTATPVFSFIARAKAGRLKRSLRRAATSPTVPLGPVPTGGLPRPRPGANAPEPGRRPR